MKKVFEIIIETLATLVMMGLMAVVMILGFTVVLPITAIVESIVNGESIRDTYGELLETFIRTVNDNI